jgi:NADPH:quinone reductase-like Zn-dependent oxidoreductase
VRALAIDEAGGALTLERLEPPAPEPDELLVRVVASSINPIDVRVATGRYPWGRFEYPVVPGYDFAGVVERTGAQVTRFAAGDAVLGYWNAPRYHRGTWAEYAAVRERGFVTRKPAGIGFEEAAALPLAGVTALLMLDATRPAAGETVLVVGAGGAICSYCVQLAARAGATVVATARPGHERRLRALGASRTIDYTRAEAPPGGLDVLIDLPNGKREVARLAALVRDGGRVASACFGADAEQLATRGVAAANVNADRCDPAVLARVVALVEDGVLSVAADELRPLAEVPAAVEEIAAGASRKTVIAVSQEE